MTSAPGSLYASNSHVLLHIFLVALLAALQRRLPYLQYRREHLHTMRRFHIYRRVLRGYFLLDVADGQKSVGVVPPTVRLLSGSPLLYSFRQIITSFV